MKGWLVPALADRIRMLKASGKRVPSKPPKGKRKWGQPFALEQRYLQKITEHLRKLTSVVDLSRYGEWLSSYHRDEESLGTGMARNLQALRAAQKELFDGGEGENFYNAILGLGSQVADFNMEQWAGFLRPLMGTEFYPMDYPGVAETLKVWGDRNFELIRSLSDTYIAQVNNLISDAVRNGTSYRDVMLQMQKIDNTITRTRAKLIARDQISKLNGELAQRRQVDAGVEAYTWSTSGDERVRGNPLGTNPKAVPSHYLMDGKTCRWDNPGVYKVGDQWVPRTARMSPTHPSREIQCRCVGIPILEGIWQEALQQA